MFGNKNFNRGNHHNRHQSEQGVCVCPKCGYSIPHTPGIPCSSKVCPVCKSWLVRSENSENKNELKASEPTNKVMTQPTPPPVVYPKVNPDLCTGCGICMDVCPTNAIVLKDDKAFIVDDLCRNCKECVRVCPSEAINE